MSAMAPSPAAPLLDAARRERRRLIALADLLGEIDDLDEGTDADVIGEAVSAASAGAALLDHLLTTTHPARAISDPTRKDQP